MSKIAEKILFVDDDENILTGYKRQLRKKADIYTALSGQEGLRLIEEEGPFAVVISDMRMPHMNGAEFLARVKTLDPDAVRIVLTGQSDMESAVEAINNGQIFRFLTKPCPPQAMAEALLSGISQYRLLTAESELLEKTLTGSIRVLTEVLSLSNPVAFGQANRLKHYVKHLIESLKVDNSWDIEMAAMLCNIGYIALPEETLKKLSAGGELSAAETDLMKEASAISVRLLKNIPRLHTVTAIIEAQEEEFRLETQVSQLDKTGHARLGGHMLKMAKYIDRQLAKNKRLDEIVEEMKRQRNEFDPVVTAHIKNIVPLEQKQTRLVNVSQLSIGMVIDEDIMHRNGTLLLSKGYEVTEAVLVRLAHYARTDAVKQPFRVISKAQAVAAVS